MYTGIIFILLGLLSYGLNRKKNNFFFLAYSILAGLYVLLYHFHGIGCIPSCLIINFFAYSLILTAIFYVRKCFGLDINIVKITFPFWVLFVIRISTILILSDKANPQFVKTVNLAALTLISVSIIVFIIYTYSALLSKKKFTYDFNRNFFKAFYITCLAYVLIFLTFPDFVNESFNSYLGGIYFPFAVLFFLSFKKPVKYPPLDLYKKAVESVRNGYIILDQFGEIRYISRHFKQDEEDFFKEGDNLFNKLRISLEEIDSFIPLVIEYLSTMEFTNIRVRFLEDNIGDIENILISLNHPKFDTKRIRLMEEKAKDIKNYITTKENEFIEAKSQLEDELRLNRTLNQELLKLRNMDALTGLSNLKAFRYELELELEICKSPHLAVFLINIDDFSLVNSYRGHTAGDELLCKSSKRLLKQIGDGTLARGNADEFFAFKAFNNIDEIEKTSNNILKTFSHPFHIKGQELEVSISIGVSVSPEDGNDANLLISYANLALKEMRLKNKNSYHFYNSRISESIEKDITIAKELVQAMDKKDIVLYYQFQVNSMTGKIVGKEALLRWKHERFGVMPAHEFVYTAEKFGILKNIDRWVLMEACRQNQIWVDQGAKSVVSVNVPRKRFEEEEFYFYVKDALDKTGLKPEYLELEITEDVLAQDLDHTLNNLNSIRDLGVKIAIDNFGFEYSSLSYLKVLPIDKIKISSIFINGIEENKIDEAIIDAIITLARKADFDLLAQGVEKHSQMVYLRDRGLDNVQGFYYFEPIDVKVIEEYNLLANN